ncbi:hypothetical protein COP2_020540 [Malus domestica]
MRQHSMIVSSSSRKRSATDQLSFPGRFFIHFTHKKSQTGRQFHSIAHKSVHVTYSKAVSEFATLLVLAQQCIPLKLSHLPNIRILQISYD